MTDRAMPRGWWPPSRRLIVTTALTGIVGLGAGVLVNVWSPNPVYGAQVIAGLVVVSFVVVAAVTPPLRGVLPAAIGLAVGLIAGIAIGTEASREPSLTTPGTVEVVLERPESTTMSAAAVCFVADGEHIEILAFDDPNLRLADGRTLALRIGPGEQEPIDPEQPVGIDLRISGTLVDGSASETQMVSDATSDVTLVDNRVTGSIAFADLVLHDLSELREPIAFEGTVRWSCPPAP